MIDNDISSPNQNKQKYFEHKRTIQTFKPDSQKDYVKDKNEYTTVNINEENHFSLAREVELMNSKFVLLYIYLYS